MLALSSDQMAYSKEHDKYLNRITSLGDGDGFEELNRIMAEIKTDTNLSFDDRHDLTYYACSYYYEMGYNDVALHYSNDYVLNLIKADDDELSHEPKEREVYLFRKIDKYILDDLQNQELSLCNPSKFNDPFDPLVSSIFRFKADYFKEPGFLHLIPSLDNVHITCFAQKGADNIEPYQRTLMWSHYADCHRGICIKMKIPRGFPYSENGNIKYGRIDDVEYKKEPTPDFLQKFLCTDYQCIPLT